MNSPSKQKATNGTAAHAHAVNGIFHISKDNIDFQATSLKWFRVAVAFFFAGSFHLNYAYNVHEHGYSCDLLKSSLSTHGARYNIPSDLDMDTALIIGIVANDQSASVQFQAYDNGTGIDGKVTWYKIMSENYAYSDIVIDDALKTRPPVQNSNSGAIDDADGNGVNN